MATPPRHRLVRVLVNERGLRRAAAILESRCAGSWITYDNPQWIVEAIIDTMTVELREDSKHDGLQ